MTPSEVPNSLQASVCDEQLMSIGGEIALSGNTDVKIYVPGVVYNWFLFERNRYFWRKRAKICVKRFSLEEFCEKCHDMVMWTFSCCLRGSRRKFLTVQNKIFVHKWTKN